MRVATPIVLKGTLLGTINDESIDELEFYSYVLTHTSDSRNFVTIGKIPASIGGSFQTLVSITSPINWLFAGTATVASEKPSNGFQLTGKFHQNEKK